MGLSSTRASTLGVPVAISLVLACSGLKHADDPPADAPDASGPDGAADATNDASVDPDAGTPPPDFECNGDPWINGTKKRPECAPRTVVVIDAEGSLEPHGISIARTKAGRLGVVYYNAHFADEGELRFVHFFPDQAPLAPTLVKRDNGPFSKAGYAARIAATGNDTFEILTHDVNDTNGDLNLVRFVDGKPPLTNPETVLTALAQGAPIALAADASGGTLYASVLRAEKVDGGTTARLVASKKPSGGGWAPLPDVAAGLNPKEAPEVGSASLVVDPSGQLHLLYHHCEVFAFSTPRYHTFDGASWSPRKTIDNAVLDGIAGFSPSVAVFGTTKHAAYFFEKAGQSPTTRTADLRVATWQGINDTPTIEILDQSIPSPDQGDPSIPPNHRVAAAVDKYGLVHLAVLTPQDSQAKSGILEYRRQTRDGSGAVKWLDDIVDPDVLSDGIRAYVDLVLDDHARPHIAYISGKDGKVRYATRTDR